MLEGSTPIMPPKLPDELLYSLWARIHRLSGNRLAQDTSEMLFRSPTAGVLHDFPSHLDDFCALTHRKYGDAKECIETGTCLPYFLRFRSPEVGLRARSMMCGPSVERLKFVLGLPSSSAGGSLMPLRYCEDCASSDEEKHGIAYWHRIHQLPGVLICPTHETTLREIHAKINHQQRKQYILPRSTVARASAYIPAVISGEAIEILRILAQVSGHVLFDDLPAGWDPERLYISYLHGLHEKGCLTSAGTVHTNAFLQGLRNTYASIHELPGYSDVLGAGTLGGFLRMVRKPRGPYHSFYHVVLIAWIFGSWERCASICLEKGNSRPDVRLQTPPERHSVLEQHPQRQSLVDLVNDGGMSVSAAAKSLDLDLSYALQIATVSGIKVSRRPKKLDDALFKRIVADLRDGNLLTKLMHDYAISKATIQRICNSEPGLRTAWWQARWLARRAKLRERMKQFLSASPNVPRGEVRRHIGIGYSWLRRHDSTWLKEVMTKHRQRATN